MSACSVRHRACTARRGVAPLLPRGCRLALLLPQLPARSTLPRSLALIGRGTRLDPPHGPFKSHFTPSLSPQWSQNMAGMRLVPGWGRSPGGVTASAAMWHYLRTHCLASAEGRDAARVRLGISNRAHASCLQADAPASAASRGVRRMAARWQAASKQVAGACCTAGVGSKEQGHARPHKA